MPCKGSLLRKFVQSAPSVYSHALSTMVWGGSDADAPAVNEVANQVRQYEDSLSHPLTVTAVEKLAEKLEEIAKTIAEHNEEIVKKNYKLFEKMGWRKDPTLPLTGPTSQSLRKNAFLQN
ncbi:hypothetical protein llap_16165 [Limosa lapponica baueri]|uniref:Uncharacterized protein n=1 Tax=Limosa lapponica baueri TaxID=1758121 RepID=A0A2I0TIE6_LIMLA|nr:hypothetical protein llap_16165 [Limosa lapponica baueri]